MVSAPLEARSPALRWAIFRAEAPSAPVASATFAGLTTRSCAIRSSAKALDPLEPIRAAARKIHPPLLGLFFSGRLLQTSTLMSPSHQTEEALLDKLTDDEVEVIAEPLAASRRVLEATPERVFQFLRAVGTHRDIQLRLAARGYTSGDHREGWRLLEMSGGFDASAPDAPIETGVPEAIDLIGQWMEMNYPIAHVSTRARHPEQHELLFRGLDYQRGPAAVLVAKELMKRLRSLRDHPERVEERGADAAALDTLARRGINEEAIARIERLVSIVQCMPETDFAELAAEEAESETHLARLKALRVWFEEWSGVARAVIHHRPDLIRLGLAQRRTRPEAAPAPEPPVA